ncbi:hypothetical protein AVEN_51727-1 [Araneus ventricosus]|uniref:Uncharacterized protein n=1 Tax=Araneus ventricosus TaxID=182803 RepID=A0A4Y2GHT4_ARAVE|nr:hypothetical protein AVEN_51727-1 [Araneus ventricosus]
MTPCSRDHFKMKKKELLSFTHSTLIRRLFRNSVVEKTSSRFLEHSSLWSFKLHLFRKTNQEQKTSSASDSKIQKNINGKIEEEARQDKTPGPTGPGGPQLEQHQPLAYPITHRIQIVTENDSRYRRPKTDNAKNLREPRWRRNNPVAKFEFKNQ